MPCVIAYLVKIGSGVNVELLHDTGRMELQCFHRHTEDRATSWRYGPRRQAVKLHAGAHMRGRGLPSPPVDGLRTASSTSSVISSVTLCGPCEDRLACLAASRPLSSMAYP